MTWRGMFAGVAGGMAIIVAGCVALYFVILFSLSSAAFPERPAQPRRRAVVAYEVDAPAGCGVQVLQRGFQRWPATSQPQRTPYRDETTAAIGNRVCLSARGQCEWIEAGILVNGLVAKEGKCTGAGCLVSICQLID